MLLIQNGILDTMTEDGTFRGDLLIEDGRISQVAERIDGDTLPPHTRMNAQGLRICPGLIDAHLHLTEDDDGRCGTDALCEEALAAGVTTQGIWTEDGCIIRHGRDAAAPQGGMRILHPDEMTEDELRRPMQHAVQQGERIACEVHDEKQLRRLLRLREETGAALVLAHLTGCEGMLAEVVASGSEVILSACAMRGGRNSYAMAKQLCAAGVTVALSSDHPTTRLHHLPLCAGLCLRSGMPRQDVMQAITLNAARLLRVDDVCGSIRAGKRADLAIFDGDPLLLATSLVSVVSGGHILQKS